MGARVALMGAIPTLTSAMQDRHDQRGQQEQHAIRAREVCQSRTQACDQAPPYLAWLRTAQ